MVILSDIMNIEGVEKIEKNRKLSFEELVRENKLEILKNEEELDKIERKIEERQLKKVE